MGDSSIAIPLVSLLGGSLIAPILKGEIYKLIQDLSGLTTIELSEIFTTENVKIAAPKTKNVFINFILSP